MLILVIFVLAVSNAVLAVSYYRQNRYDGFVELEEDPGGVVRANLIVNGDPETLLTTKDSIRFKVRRDEVSRS
jgi:hypothetical protein